MFIKVTPKAYALIAAVNAGLVKETESGEYDIEAFEMFWAEFSKSVQLERRPTIWKTIRLSMRRRQSRKSVQE